MTDGKNGGIAGEIGVLPDFVRRIAQDTARIRRRMAEIAETEAAAADHSLGDRVARAIRIFNSAGHRDGAGPPVEELAADRSGALTMPDAPDLRREFGTYHQNAMAFMAALEKLEQSNALLAEAARRSSGHVCSHLCGTSAPAFPHDAFLAEASAKGWP